MLAVLFVLVLDFASMQQWRLRARYGAKFPALKKEKKNVGAINSSGPGATLIRAGRRKSQSAKLHIQSCD